MSVTVKIPTPLRALTGDRDKVDAEGATLSALVDELEGSFPGMRERLCDEDGGLRRFVNVYVNGEDVRFLQGLDTALGDGDEVSIVPAVAGGAG
jgi:molybdopterin synthase sulfur carrier subunit